MEKQGKLYKTIYRDLLRRIQSGELKVGEKLPTELELTAHYGVSRITVAHALRELAEANLVYRVKGSGTFVNGKRNRNAPLVIPTLLPIEETFGDIMRGVQTTALADNVFTPFYDSKNNIDRERQQLLEIAKSDPDGLIVYPCATFENLDVYAELLARGVPVVCIDRAVEGLDLPLVTTNNAECMRRIVSRLVEQGHRKIGFFFIDEMMATTERERFTGFCRGLIDHKLPLVREYVFNTSDMHRREMTSSPERRQLIFRNYVRREFAKYTELAEKPTALCCLNDSTLEAAAEAAAAYGVKIPEELTLTGFDCADERAKRRGYLSARQDFFGMGAAAVSLILKIVNGEPYPSRVLVEGLLVNRTP